MNRTLFIIGNGFDRYLGIASSYQDFHNYMISQWTNGAMLSNQLENIFPALDDNGDPLLWSDFEDALGKMDRDGVMDYCQIGLNIDDYEELPHYAYDIEDSPDTYLSSILSDLDVCFHAWVNSLAIYGGETSLPYFEKEALYFSFNYTETLENIFKIPNENICHIHGRRYVSDHYIYGHDTNHSQAIIGDTFVEDVAFEKIENYYHGIYKDTSKHIKENSGFFDKIRKSSIIKVIVYGCSLSEMDLPYFTEINKCISCEADWLFSVYDKARDVMAVKRLMSLLELDVVHCQTFDLIRK
jgi:hypothetical protein